MASNWDVVPLTKAADAGGEPPAEQGSPGPLLLEGEVVAASRVPRPFTVPYKDCLTYVKVRIDRVVTGSFKDHYVIAVLWAMKDNVLLAPANYGPGKRLRLEVVPFRQAPVDLRSIRVADDLDDYTHPPFYVLKESSF